MTAITPTAVNYGERELVLAGLDEALLGVDELVPLDDARFLETHEIYEGCSDQQQRIIEWFGERIAPSLSADRPFRVLSVGCGGGLLDVPVASRFAAQCAQLHYVGVNPNPVECAVFERVFRKAVSGARLELFPEPFETFHTDQQFDLIHFVHSLYYLPDAAEALRKAKRLLAPEGRLVACHAPREALNDLAVRFYDKHYERPTLFAEDLAELIGGWGWSCERQRVDARVDVTSFVKGDPGIGHALRDFMVQVDSRKLPSEVLLLVERYLQHITVEDRERAYIPHPVDAFLIDG